MSTTYISKITLIAGLILSSVLSACDGSFGIKGVVYDSDQKTLTGVALSLTGTREDSDTSDANGKYSLFFVDSGSAKCSSFDETISATLNGYEKYESKVDLCKETHDITLKKTLP